MAARPTDLPDVALSLALAIVGSSASPVVLLDGDLKVIAASGSFFRAFHIDPATARGRVFFDLGDGEWDIPQLRNLLKATASGSARVDAYELDLKGGPDGVRRLVLGAHKLDYHSPVHDGLEPVRLMLSVADVTEAQLAAKLKDELLREKAALLQQVQHRVANSLQVIASVILQSARKPAATARTDTPSADVLRPLSTAALHQQLANAQIGGVALRDYFEQLCASIGASMIQDPKQLTLTVEADDSVVEAEVSVSLGLIVTELVINCLKHAFPDRRAGHIAVGYKAQGSKWTLSVGDDGVGMPKDPADRVPGLGTAIVEALANQLEAGITVSDAHPGTMVCIVHSKVALAAVAI